MTTTNDPRIIGKAMETRPDQIADARAWIADTFSDAPDDLTDREVIAAIQGHYDGGLAQFIADGNYPNSDTETEEG